MKRLEKKRSKSHARFIGVLERAPSRSFGSLQKQGSLRPGDRVVEFWNVPASATLPRGLEETQEGPARP